ncbi:PAS domain S-box protein [Roseibium sp. CAU 1637]|uniref:histidine kinase n=1 Tax=Roseibium limicola TaxID=2816037 RepID=A0A939EPK8_9HYPH|nr:ATP-binding protein [Roseibium limicola]MBO0346349.1 PAS domain S-box protein [Roseibium limicola]
MNQTPTMPAPPPGRRTSMRVRIILLVSISVLLSTLVVGGVAYYRISSVVRTQGEAVLESETRLVSVRFQRAFYSIEKDLRTLAGTPPIDGIGRAMAAGGLDPLDRSTTEDWRERLEKIFAALMMSERSYFQIRLISIENSGRELVRVESRNGEISSVKPSDLQDKSTEDYFIDAMDAAPGEVFFSELTFNRELGRRDPNEIPTLRAILPFAGMNGKPSRFLIINIDYEKMLNTNFEVVAPQYKTIVTTQNGDYIIHDPSNENMKTSPLEMHEEYTVEPPAIIGLVGSEKRPEGFFEFADDVDYLIHVSGRPGIVLPRLGIILQLPKSTFTEPSRTMRRDVLLAGGLLTFICILLAALVARSLMAPLKHLMDTIRTTSPSQLLRNLPVTRQDEVGDLARALDNRTRQLMESETRAELILANMLEGTILFDSMGVIEQFNQSATKILGYSAEEIVGTNVSALLDDRLQGQYNGFLYDPDQNSMVGRSREMDLLMKNGEHLPVEISVNAVQVMDRIKYSCVFRDIRERREVERLKAEFVSTVSHELRTPLTSIRGSLDLVTGLLPAGFPANLEHMLQLASKNTERLILLVNDILDFEKLQVKKTVFKPVLCSVGDLLQPAIDLHESLALERSVTLLLGGENLDCRIEVDPDRFQQIAANYLSNAIKFSNSGGRVTVSAKRHGSNLRVVVTDEGTGVPESFKRFVFTPFTQADATISRQRGGTGLGLAIVKRLAEGMGGSVGFSSVSGKGSHFWVEFPQAQRPHKPGALDSEGLGDRLRGLHLEDDNDFASVLSALLQDSVALRNVESLAEARQLLIEEDFDVFIVDIGLTDGNGLEILSEIPDRGDKPVIVVTAIDQPIEDDRVDIIIVKSKYSQEALVRNINAQVSQYRERLAKGKEIDAVPD